jgi:2-dehydropantoate 2-reductase
LAEVSRLHIGVLGPGAIGGLLGALLWRAQHKVVMVGKEDRIARLEAQGLPLQSPVFGDFVARPRLVTVLAEPVDILIVTVKAPHLPEALARIDPRAVVDAVVIPLLNGVGHREVIEAALGAQVATGAIGSVEVAMVDGAVRQLSKQYPHIDLAVTALTASTLGSLAEAVRDAGITVDLQPSEATVIWRKLVRLCALASVTAAAQQPIGVVRADPHWRPRLEGLAREGALVATREGVAIDPAAVMEAIDRLPAGLTTSLQRDLGAGVPSELESITGAVLRLAQRHGLHSETLTEMYALLKQKARP